jgi:hypothetical protein
VGESSSLEQVAEGALLIPVQAQVVDSASQSQNRALEGLDLLGEPCTVEVGILL